MKFREINAAESYCPMNGKTFTDTITVRGNHTKAHCMMQGYSVRRDSDDMHMRQFKFFTKATKDLQNSTSTRTKFIITTKVYHFGVEDDFWVKDHDSLWISYNVLIIIP